MYGDPAQLLAIATLPSLVDSFANVEGAQFGSLDESVALTADALAAQG